MELFPIYPRGSETGIRADGVTPDVNWDEREQSDLLILVGARVVAGE